MFSYRLAVLSILVLLLLKGERCFSFSVCFCPLMTFLVTDKTDLIWKIADLKERTYLFAVVENEAMSFPWSCPSLSGVCRKVCLPTELFFGPLGCGKDFLWVSECTCFFYEARVTADGAWNICFLLTGAAFLIFDEERAGVDRGCSHEDRRLFTMD